MYGDSARLTHGLGARWDSRRLRLRQRSNGSPASMPPASCGRPTGGHTQQPRVACVMPSRCARRRRRAHTASRSVKTRPEWPVSRSPATCRAVGSSSREGPALIRRQYSVFGRRPRSTAPVREPAGPSGGALARAAGTSQPSGTIRIETDLCAPLKSVRWWGVPLRSKRTGGSGNMRLGGVSKRVVRPTPPRACRVAGPLVRIGDAGAAASNNGKPPNSR